MRVNISLCSKHACVLILLTLFAFSTRAQKVISGSVTDSKTGAGIANVTVLVKGTKAGTQTNTDGSFYLNAPASANALVLTAVGYGRQEVALGGRSSLSIVMVNTASTLSDVVVIAYGTARKKDLTGSVSTVTAKDFQKGSISTPEQLIAGKVAGVSIISNGGQPGSGSQIRIRGGSSLNASNDPLIVIDGVPLAPNRNPDGSSAIAGSSDPLSLINPNDIESFTILKDASAAAIYGTRASNGVIIITTKKGRGGKFRVNFSSVNSLSDITKNVGVLSANQIRSIVNQYGTTAQKAQVGNASTNWQNLIYQKAFGTDNNISMTGGLKKLPYRLSLGYTNKDGILKTDNLERKSIDFALNPMLLNNHLKVDINFKGSVENTRFANQGAIGAAVYFDPTQSPYSGSKRYGGYFEWLNADGTPNTLAARNPLAQLYDRHDNGMAQRSIGNIQLDYKFPFLPDLHANLNLGYDVSKGTGTIFVSDSASIEYATHGENNHYKQTTQNTLAEFYLNYTKDIASIKSRIEMLAGYSYNNYLTTNYNYARYTAHGTKVVNSDPAFPFDKPEHTLLSYFGRLNYTYNDRYLLTATLRDDASSRFSSNNRYAIFPSLAVAWNLKEESFLKSTDKISTLKIRGGYGITGQQEGIGNYDYLSYYALSSATASYEFGNTYYQGYRPGGFYANRKWEQTATTNVGIDFGILSNRISGSFDYYFKRTTNLLNSVPQPAGTNFSAYVLANVGSMNNEGVEFSINASPVVTKNVTWDVAFNATYNKNTITNLTVIPDDPNYLGFPSTNISGVQGFAFLNAVGTSKNTFYLYKQVYDKTTSKPIEGLFEDINRDGIINENDKYKGKRADPDVFLGFSTNVSYKKFNAGFVMRASFDNYVYNNVFSANGRLNTILGQQAIGNASSNYLTTLFKGNTDQQLLSDYYIQNASFLRMDNINAGYNFGGVIHNKAQLRLNLNVQNVFVITKYQGLDPEISNGVDNNLYPRPRIYSLGINLDF